MIAEETTSPPGPDALDRSATPIDPREPAVRAAFENLRDAIDAMERAMLLALGAPVPPVTTVPLVRRDVMKPREYAEHMRVNVRKVHGWIHTGMPHFLVEGRIRIRVADADAWLETQATKRKLEPKSERGKTSKRKTVRTRKSKVQAKEPKSKETRSKAKSKRDRQGGRV